MEGRHIRSGPATSRSLRVAVDKAVGLVGAEATTRRVVASSAKAVVDRVAQPAVARR